MKTSFSGYHAAENIVAYVLKAFWAVPQSLALFSSPATFSRVQEESMHTPHIALLGLLALPFFGMCARSLSIGRKLGCALYTIVLAVFILLLVRGTGIVPEYLQKPVTQVFQPTTERVSDFHYLFSGSTGTRCYEALNLQLPELKKGSVSMEYDGAFNIYNPACMHYSEANNCLPRDRISVDDAHNLLLFTHGQQPSWKLSALQIWADRLTLAGLVLFPFALLWILRKR